MINSSKKPYLCPSMIKWIDIYEKDFCTKMFALQVLMNARLFATIMFWSLINCPEINNLKQDKLSIKQWSINYAILFPVCLINKTSRARTTILETRRRKASWQGRNKVLSLQKECSCNV